MVSNVLLAILLNSNELGMIFCLKYLAIFGNVFILFFLLHFSDRACEVVISSLLIDGSEGRDQERVQAPQGVN